MTALVLAFCVSILSGIACAHIAHRKHLTVTWYAVAGFLLPVLDLVVVTVEPPGPPPPPCAVCAARASG